MRKVKEELEKKGFECIEHVRLPFDMVNAEDGKNYGIHGLDIWFVLKGPKGAVQLMVNFPVYLPHIDRSSWRDPWSQQINGFDVGYHALEAQFEGQQPTDCDYFGKCYCDGSALRAKKWVEEIFSVRGRRPEEVLWPMLEREYEDRFGKVEVAQ